MFIFLIFLLVGNVPQVIFFWSFEATIAVQPEGMRRYVSATQISERRMPQSVAA